MGGDQPAGDGQPQTGTLGGAGRVTAPQLVEDAGKVGLGDAAAAVPDPQHRRVMRFATCWFDGRPGGVTSKDDDLARSAHGSSAGAEGHRNSDHTGDLPIHESVLV